MINNHKFDIVQLMNITYENLNFRMQFLFTKDIRSLILTSGTLAPLKPLITEMDLGNAIQLKNPHIIQPFQVCVKIIESGPNKIRLDSSFGNRYCYNHAHFCLIMTKCSDISSFFQG